MVDRNLASISCFLRIQTRIGQRLEGIHSKRQALIKTRPKTYKSTGRKYKNKAVKSNSKLILLDWSGEYLRWLQAAPRNSTDKSPTAPPCLNAFFLFFFFVFFPKVAFYKRESHLQSSSIITTNRSFVISSIFIFIFISINTS